MHRWTDGQKVLPVPSFCSMTRGLVCEHRPLQTLAPVNNSVMKPILGEEELKVAVVRMVRNVFKLLSL